MKNNYPLLSVCLLALPFQSYAQKKANETKPNILFICVDDLRRELGAYGSIVKTPNIDRLASQGSLFFQHYVQVPTSGASRASMLTGHFPQDKSDLSNEACRTRLSDKPEGEIPETMFHHLRRNGYYTVGIGKISHYVDGCLYGYEAPISLNCLIVGMKCFSTPENGGTGGMPFSDMRMAVAGKTAKSK